MTNNPKDQTSIPPGQQANFQQADLRPVSCDASIEELYGYLDGALDQTMAQNIQSHLATCSGCDEVFSFHNRLQTMVGQLGRTEMPTELPERIFGSILGLTSAQEGLLAQNLDDSALDPKRRPFDI